MKRIWVNILTASFLLIADTCAAMEYKIKPNIIFIFADDWQKDLL